ncbi:mastermind-like protein 3 [Drosophila obscura]|uniref:mastermind-like protein 3 n=1 Tax=Drosophila obscura TaxID=7282 RepID=UPI001BB1FB62|nr:mastermind-like protein 3 [Drosophila obscura]
MQRTVKANSTRKMNFASKMRVLLVLGTALLSLAQAAEVPQTTGATTTTGKPQQGELPEHIQTLITNHIHHVLQHVKNNPQRPHTLTGTVEASKGSGSPVAEPFSGLLPPLAHPSDVHLPAPDQPTASPALQPGLQPLQANDPQVRVINHEATGSIFHQGRPVVQNKVVMPPVPQVVLSLPGQQPADVADKVNKLQQHVTHVMQQAQLHIPLAIQEAIKRKKEQQKQQEAKDQNKEEQKEQQQENEDPKAPQPDSPSTPVPTKSKTGRSLDKWPHHANQVNIPQLIAQHEEEIELGKCSFQCPRQALSICASNGKCVVNFPGQCELSQWNCFNTKNVFHQVHDAECQNTVTCYKRDMM